MEKVMSTTVMVFATSVQQDTHIDQLRPVLDGLLVGREKWNFDLEDRENILRVEAAAYKGSSFKTALKEQGFHCEELH